MINYASVFTYTNGSPFPNTKAIDASGPTATDGTEFTADLVNNVWGFHQALMDHAGLTPDGNDEEAGASQLMDALAKGYAIGPGIGVIYWKNDDPATLGDRVLLLHGQVITIASYPELVAATYCGDANNATASVFFKTSDAGGTTRSTSGTYFVLADSRGVAFRGLDSTGTVDPDGASRDLGHYQADAFDAHTHDFTAKQLTGSYGAGTGAGVTDSGSTSFTTTSTGGDETRMKNIAVNYGITY